MFLYVRLILCIGKHFNCNRTISLFTGCILLIIQILLVIPDVCFIISQSFFVSIVFSLLSMNIFEKLNLFSASVQLRHQLSFNLTLTISIFIISITKISTGFIFWIAATWFFMRQSIPIHKRIILFTLSTLAFIPALMLVIGSPTGNVSTESA